MRVGVLGALPQEVAGVLAMLDPTDRCTIGGRDFVRARRGDVEVVVTHSRIGKVAAAVASVELVAQYRVDQIVFLGVAGSLCSDLAAGDIVIAERLVQHDLDASPLFPPMEIPLLGRTFLETDAGITDSLQRAAEGFLLAEHPMLPHARDAVAAPRLVRGDVATGDRFIASPDARALVRRRVPTALCVEMEGAAVAQVCVEYGVPLGVARVISDDADHDAAHSFNGALERFAGACAGGIIRRYLDSL